MPTFKQKVHLCNCDYCEKKSTCLICKTTNNLHRAHLIPRRLVDLVPESDLWDKTDWLSYTGNNCIVLCKEHHNNFDSFKLNAKDSLLINYHLGSKLEEFMVILKNKQIKKSNKITLYLDRLREWFNLNYGETYQKAERVF